MTDSNPPEGVEETPTGLPDNSPSSKESSESPEIEASKATPEFPEAMKSSWRYLLSMAMGGMALFLFGFILSSLIAPATTLEPGSNSASATAQIWTCSMHPKIRLPKPGRCPICNMVLVKASSSDNQEAKLEMSEASLKISDIETASVERRIANITLRFVGEVAYDETRVKTITAWIPGRLDRLYVDYTGVSVNKGDHLVYLYSPDLISAQEELIQALRAVKELKGSNSEFVKSTALDTVKAASEKLRLLGLTELQVKRVKTTLKVEDHLTIFAPTGGIVVHKNAIEGMYVKTGSTIYKIADLSSVWVNLEAYESDLAWLRYGQSVQFSAEAYPGKTFKGRISFIDPILNTRTRTVKIRVNVPNPNGQLKPGMFVKALINAQMASNNEVIEDSLVGKWVGPMHPEVVKDIAGNCEFCGMPLVRAETLGFAGRNRSKTKAPLLVPRSAVLLTGERAVVYIKKKNTKRPIFEGRVITLGPRAGDYYIIQGGLMEGDEVVTQGAFKIDSALQIQAKPSMMTESESVPSKSDNKAPIKIGKADQTKLRVTLNEVLSAYLQVANALRSDKYVPSNSFAELEKSCNSLQAASKELNSEWQKLVKDMARSAKTIAQSRNLNKVRTAFSAHTQSLVLALKAIGSPRAIRLFHCPMAFGGVGATWLQIGDSTRNPYLGKAMLGCGNLVSTFSEEKGEGQ